MPVNLVFQGGGVRGIVYAGVLDQMTLPLDNVKGTGGTSAGSIVAALIGIGKNAAQIRDILEKKQLWELLHKEDEERLRQITEGLQAVRPLIEEALKSGSVPKLGFFKVRKQVKALLTELGCVWRDRGLHRSDKLGGWLDEVLEGKTFDDAWANGDGRDVQIVAADVSGKKYEIYNRKKYGARKLSQAVHASCSIPVFFRPFVEGVGLAVDGGILSNYPAFLFAQSKYATIGFRLKDLTPVPPGPISTTRQYLQAILETMTDAHDKLRPLPRYIFSYEIGTPPHIRFDNFRLTEGEKAELFQLGQETGKHVKWKDHEDQDPQVSFFDPNADETLEFSTSQARALYDAYAGQQPWVKTLRETNTMTVRIDKDWTATYQRVQTMKVEGQASLFLRRFRRAGLAQTDGSPVSFMRTKVGLRELVLSESDRPAFLQAVNDGKMIPELRGQFKFDTRDLIRIPAYNSENHKGFVIFYTPPISEDQPARVFLSIHSVEREFARVPLGEPGEVTLAVQGLAQNHVVNLEVRILVDTELQQPRFNPLPMEQPGARQIGERFYTQQVWKFGPLAVAAGTETVQTINVLRGVSSAPEDAIR